jgi:hypothetical protein
MDKESAIAIIEGYYKAMMDKYIREESDTSEEKGELYGMLKGYKSALGIMRSIKQ